MAKAQWFKFYPQDFVLGTIKLSNSEVGAYIKLLCYQWDKGFIPNSESEIEEITGVKKSKLTKVLRKFEFNDKLQLINIRLNAEKEKVGEYAERQASNGSKGGRPKKIENPKKPNPNPTLTQPLAKKSHTEADTEAEVFTNVNTQEADEEADAGKVGGIPSHLMPANIQPFIDIEDCADRFLTTGEFLAAKEQLCIREHLTVVQMIAKVKVFNANLTGQGIAQKQMFDWLRHLGFWLPKSHKAAPTTQPPAVRSAAEINRQRNQNP